MGHFILWYGFLRFFVDFFREYRSSMFGLPPGQEFNLLMTLIGVGMLIWLYRKARPADAAERSPGIETRVATGSGDGIWLKRTIFVLLLVLPTIIPSDWTQDVPARYGARHPGMTHSTIYPPIRN